VAIIFWSILGEVIKLNVYSSCLQFVRDDGKINIADAMFIAWYLAGLRNENLKLKGEDIKIRQE